MRSSLLKSLASISLFLAILCLLSVIAFHFPEFLSNPKLRQSYNVDHLRLLLFVCLYISFGLSLAALFISPYKGRAFAALILVVAASMLGGSSVEVPAQVHQRKFYLSLDLIILDLFFMSLLFVPVERMFYLRKQRFLRPGLRADLGHYGFNHLLMGGVFYLVTLPGNWLRDRMVHIDIQQFTQNLPLWVQVLLIFLVADFAQYWIHRLFHHRDRLWQFHKIHHSTKAMDWLASSRLHIVDVIVTRAFSYIPVVCLGFSEAAIQIYLPAIALQAVFVHSNVRFRFGPLKYVLTTPMVHHWHHSSEAEALNKNFAVTFSFFDVLFGTFYCPDRWPSEYGLFQESISESFLRQLTYPFIKVGHSLIETSLKKG